MKRSLFSLLLSCILFAGCATLNYSGDLEPVTPKPAWRPGYGQAQSLQPTLVWRDTAKNRGSAATYDLVVYEAVWVTLEPEVGSVIPPQVLRPGNQVYYRENITGTSHTLGKELIPNAYYCWTVRRREGTNVSPWSTWGGKEPLGNEEKTLWAFKTPRPQRK